MDADVQLPLYCPVCGQAVSLLYAPREAYQRAWWECPYDQCGRIHRVDVKGTDVRAIARCEPPKE